LERISARALLITPLSWSGDMALFTFAVMDDKTIQAILRHSNIGITQNIYIKSVNESQVSAMDSLSEKLGICNVYATSEGKRLN
jgi:integrase